MCTTSLLFAFTKYWRLLEIIEDYWTLLEIPGEKLVMSLQIALSVFMHGLMNILLLKTATQPRFLALHTER